MITGQRSNIIKLTDPNKSLAFSVGQVPKSEPGILIRQAYRFFDKSTIDTAMKQYKRAIVTKDAVKTDFLAGNVEYISPPEPDSEDSVCYSKAVEWTRKTFSPVQKYRPVHYCDLRYYNWELSTTIEEPFASDPKLKLSVKEAYQRGEIPTMHMNKQNLYNVAFVTNRNIIHQIKEGTLPLQHRRTNPDTLAHARSHISKTDEGDKVRMVFGAPWLILMVEAMLLWPLFNFLKKGTTPIAWTYETMLGGARKLLQELPIRCDYICLDWSKFDKRVPFWLIDSVHDIWESYIRYDDGYIKTFDYPESRFAEKVRFQRLFDYMRHYVKWMPIRTPDGGRWRRSFAGIPSGNRIIN